MYKNQRTHSMITHAMIAAAFLLVAMAPGAHAAVPDGINYQAYLTNTDGSPVDTSVSITFAAYNVDLGGVPLWNQTQPVIVEQGLFTVQLGNPANPFPAGLFDGPVYIGMFVAGEELLPRRPMTSTGFAFKANDADTIDGADAADLDQSGEVTALQGAVSSVESDVSATQSAVANNDGRLTALEGSAGDITGVGAGAGLTGGGAAGNVSLGVAPNGIVGTMLATGVVSNAKIANAAVNGAKIQDGSVSGTDIAVGTVQPNNMNPNTTFDFRGVDVGADGFEVNSAFDIIIRDDFNGMRWFSADGATEFGSITARPNDFTMRDAVRARNVFTSNVNGVGFAGATPVAGYAATMPSLNVTGQAALGLERVNMTYLLNIETAQCYSHGNLPCWWGTQTVACPVGKRVIGGGSNGSAPRYGAIGQSYPSSDTSWFCASSYDIAGSSDVCFAICANIE